MKQVPFVVCSVNEMEEFAYLLKTNDLADLVRCYWNDPEKSDSFIGYLSHRYKNELKTYQYAFSNEINDIFTIKIPS